MTTAALIAESLSNWNKLEDAAWIAFPGAPAAEIARVVGEAMDKSLGLKPAGWVIIPANVVYGTAGVRRGLTAHYAVFAAIRNEDGSRKYVDLNETNDAAEAVDLERRVNFPEDYR